MSDESAPVAAPTTPAVPESNGGWPSFALSSIGTERDGQSADAQVDDDGNPVAEVDPNATEYWTPDEATGARKTKLKVDGEERDVTVAELHTLAQKGLSADERFKKAAQIQRAFEDKDKLLEATMRDPAMFFEEMIAGDEASAMVWIDKLVGHALARQKMTPEQRQLSAYQRREQEREQAEQARIAEQSQAKFNAAWDRAVKLAELPDNALGHAVAAEMRERVAINRQTGRKDTVEQLAAFAKQRMGDLRAEFQRTMTPEQRQALVTPDDVRARASEAANRTKPMVPQAPVATPPRGQNGQFQSGNKAIVYDPFV